MVISFIRHGKSQWIENNRLTCKEFIKWTEQYNCTGVYKGDFYPPETIKALTSSGAVFTSNLKRSLESAKSLNPNVNYISSSLFREVELPQLKINFLRIKLKPTTWVVLLRCLWLLGYSRGCESLNEARIRANKASKCLIDYAMVYESVVLVGHGFFNLLIAKELRKTGWTGKKKPSTKHWHVTNYFYSHESS